MSSSATACKRAAPAELLVEQRERSLSRLAGVGQLVQEPRAVEVLDARHPARVRIGAQVAPLDELGERIGDGPRIGRTVRGELRHHVLGAQVYDEPALGGDECQHHPPVQSGVLRRQVGERLEPPGFRLLVVSRAILRRTVAGRSDGMSTICRRVSAFRPRWRLCSVAPWHPEPPSIRIRTDELRTVREAMRDFGSLLTELEDGEVEKLVLTQRNRMRAVVVSVERWSEVEQALAVGDDASTKGLAPESGSSVV